MMAVAARRLGCTEGQAYTVAIGIVLTLAAAFIGLPPTLRDRVTAPSTAAEVASAPAPPPNTDTPAAAPPADSTSGAPPAAATSEAAAPPTAAPAAPATPAAPPVDDTAAPATPAPPPAAAAVAPRGFGPAEVAARVGSPGAPDGVAVDGEGRVNVATNNGLLRGGAGASKVIRYRPDGKVDRELAITGQDPARTGGLTGLVVGAEGEVLVLDTAPPRVLRLDLDRGKQDVLAELPDAAQPRALAMAGDGTLFVTDSGQGLIWRIPTGGEPEQWHAFGEDEAAASPTGIAIDGAGDVLVVTAVALRESTGAGLVQRIDVRPDGSAGDRTVVAATDPLSGPAGLAVTSGGGIVVALSAANELLLLGPDGTQRARLTADDVASAAGTPLDGPTGVAIRGDSVVVSNQSPTANDESHWVVFDVPLTP